MSREAAWAEYEQKFVRAEVARFPAEHAFVTAWNARDPEVAVLKAERDQYEKALKEIAYGDSVTVTAMVETAVAALEASNGN